jgi:hypothetical protein
MHSEIKPPKDPLRARIAYRIVFAVVCLCSLAFQRVAARALDESAALRAELAARKAQIGEAGEAAVKRDDGWQRYAPRNLNGWASCEEALKQWDHLYGEQVANSDEMIRSGFRSPVPARKSTFGSLGTGIELETGGLGKIEWSKPIGFALVDCDSNVHMIDKAEPIKLSLSWDTTRKCLNANPR